MDNLDFQTSYRGFKRLQTYFNFRSQGFQKYLKCSNYFVWIHLWAHCVSSMFTYFKKQRLLRNSTTSTWIISQSERATLYRSSSWSGSFQRGFQRSSSVSPRDFKCIIRSGAIRSDAADEVRMLFGHFFCLKCKCIITVLWLFSWDKKWPKSCLTSSAASDLYWRKTYLVHWQWPWFWLYYPWRLYILKKKIKFFEVGGTGRTNFIHIIIRRVRTTVHTGGFWIWLKYYSKKQSL